jgi:phenylalanine ammonia-lyase
MATQAQRIISIDGESLSLVDLAAVAYGEARVELHQSARARAEASYQQNRRLFESGAVVYGVTTGVGDSVERRIHPERARRMQEALVRLCECGSGAILDHAPTRAVVLARANSLAKGFSAVRPLLIERLLDMLNQDILPLIPEQGSIGASGDLAPSSYIAAALMGERQVRRRGETVPAEKAWAELGKQPLHLESKEGLAVLNGTCFMSGLAALALLDSERVARVADLCTALTCEVLTGISDPFHPFIHELKLHPGQARSAGQIRAWLEGSQLVRTVVELLDQVKAAGATATRKLPVRIQDKYSLRCAPQCIGALYDTIAWAKPWIERELNSANDNPLYDPARDQVHSGGNFSGFHVALAMDALKTATASVADLLDRQFAVLVDERSNNGLTPNLVTRLSEDDPDADIYHGFKTAQIALSALAAEALGSCMPMSLFSRSTECHNQDKVSMGAAAARKARDVVELTERCCAMHLLGACQAADLRGAERLGKTRAAYQKVRAASPMVAIDRALDGDIQLVVELIRSGALLADAPTE